MTPTPLTTVRSRAVCLLRDDIDTDQIIPARFLTTTSASRLGRHLFADWRYEASGTERSDFPLHGASGAQILVARCNFGCGSSREHAPWALAGWGFRVVIAQSFGDIFRSNAHQNGLLTVQLDPPEHDALVRIIEADPARPAEVDLSRQQVRLAPDFLATFFIDPFSRTCLMEGMDELGYLLATLPLVDAWERTTPAVPSTCDAVAAAELELE